MTDTIRVRSDSMVSVDDPDMPMLVDEPVLEDEVLMAVQGDDVELLRGVAPEKLHLPTAAKTYALHEACEHGSLRVVKFLVEELDCDVDVRDDQQWTPLHYAATFQGAAPALVHYLLAAGADAAAEDDDGATPLASLLEETAGDDDESDDPLVGETVRILESVLETADGDYEAWAVLHARDATFRAYVQASRPAYCRAADRHQFAVLHANAAKHDAQLATGASPEAFLLGAHGGHTVFSQVLSFLA